MIRFCPNCQTERPLHEIFCEGEIDGQACGWELTSEPIRPEGWRPQPVITREEAEPATELPANKSTSDLLCENGHPMEAGELMCLECGAGPALPETSGDSPDAAETLIDGWRLLRHLSSTDGVHDRYIAEHAESARQAVLTLYHVGAEPDPAIYDVLRRLPREHVPEIIATGRWNERAYEVMEELSGGTLADLGIVFGQEDTGTVRHVVRELGSALHAFNEAGLRHRGLRPGALLVRSHEPLDLVICGFGSASLSEFDLDIVSPLETSRYMAPEAIAGGVAAASDWWSLGMILLEQFTQGGCFADIHPNAFMIHVLANGVLIPDTLNPALRLLLRGLLARDRHQRWQWSQVQDWLNGLPVEAPAALGDEKDDDGASIALGERRFRKPALYALAAAQAEHWPQALESLTRGELATWAQKAGLAPKTIERLGQAARLEGVDDFRLTLALKLLNPEMPLIYQGEIITPGWLLASPQKGYWLMNGPLPALLEAWLGTQQGENWLTRLQMRAKNILQRAANQRIELSEEELRIYLLSTSRAKLLAQWQERARLLPDSDHPGILALADRKEIADEDLIILLSANISQFRSAAAIIEEATTLAQEAGVSTFVREAAAARLQQSRQELFAAVDKQVSGFVHCHVAAVNAWAEQFRLQRRLSLTRALVLLAVAPGSWHVPPKQQYFAQLMEYFGKKIAVSITRGALARMNVSPHSSRIDLMAVDSARRPATVLLEHLLQRNTRAMTLDINPGEAYRLRSLSSQSQIYRRDTGIDGLYLGFPFLLYHEARNVRPYVVPLLLWPVKLETGTGTGAGTEEIQRVAIVGRVRVGAGTGTGRQQHVSLAFDDKRKEIRLNPALESLLGVESVKPWREAADVLLGRSAARATDVMDAFAALATVRSHELQALPLPETAIGIGHGELACSAVLFHVAFMAQAIREDLRRLQRKNVDILQDTGLAAMLRLREESAQAAPEETDSSPELQRFFTAASDPSQETAVFRARQAPGLLMEGPPGTGKSQTIVNMVADAIGRKKSVLIVCQKFAALEVVHKRLRAEGLAERVVMINDVNDRFQIIRHIRNPLEILFSSMTGKEDAAALERQREYLAARIQMIEGELDRLHAATYRLDAASGMSYRQITGELIQLEAARPLPEFPLLRQRLAMLDSAELARREQNCAALVSAWLPAAYEDSPFAQLRTFAADPATLGAFTAALHGFANAEEIRQRALQAHPSPFELDAAAACRAWTQAHASSLLNLPDPVRQHLAHWLPLFRRDEGEKLLNESEALSLELRTLNTAAWLPRLSPALNILDDKRLTQIAAAARKELEADSWLARLNPLRLLRLAALRRFFAGHDHDSDSDAPPLKARLPGLLAAARLEGQWRTIRPRFSALRRPLGLPEIAQDAGLELIALANDDVQHLRKIRTLAGILAQAPCPDEADAAVLSGHKQDVETFLAQLDAALTRLDTRQKSLDALTPLESWINDELLETLRQSIRTNQSESLLLQRMQAALPQLAAYQIFRSRIEGQIENGQFQPVDLEFLALLREREMELAQIPDNELEHTVRRLFRREACLGWKQQIERAHPELLCQRAEIQAKVASLAEADCQIRQLNRKLLATMLDKDTLGDRRAWEDITRLTGVRALRLREFITRGVDLGLLRLCPVWLMNPDVASRVLPLQAGLFDIVIYDEASQMPVEYALPTLYRGRVIVVSGDEKQMPPTAFFSSRIESDEAEIFEGETGDESEDEASEEAQNLDDWNRREIKDHPDLLHLARAALPGATLQIHYRSVYRELIAFSNAAFYRNRLNVPARHPESRILNIKPLELTQVNGLYQNQSNEEEAEQVTEYLAELWRLPVPMRPSVGIVTFNRKQADLIEDHLEWRASWDEGFQAAYARERERNEGGEDMSVFVKNVENVQGDERDIIVFSTTFGRNAQGVFRRAFGVLGQSGGERRLNVAITRARQKVKVITSMPIADISDMLTTQRPPGSPRDYLQAYLEYARMVSAGEFASARYLLARIQTGHTKTDIGAATQPGDGFTAAVASFIRSLGWQPVAANEKDVFGLDFAIEHPETGLYAIGIECDTPRHSLLVRARAREIWRPSVLTRSIPHIHRISSQAWRDDGERERALLTAAIEKALQADNNKMELAS
jgi:hypothetical protein